METVDYAWAAGFIDGEGSMGIKRFIRRLKTGKKYIYYCPYISLAQAVVSGHEKGVIRMQEMFGGSVAQWTPKSPTNNYPTSQWSVVSRNAIACIDKIHPYLLIKKPNADLLLRWYKEVTVYSGGSQKNQITSEEHKIRHNLYIESSLLSQKGRRHEQRLNEEIAQANVIV